MTYNVYVLRDNVTGIFKAPFLMYNDAEAMRWAKWAAKEQKESEIDGIELFKIGTYNNENSIVVQENIKRMCTLMELKNME